MRIAVAALGADLDALISKVSRILRQEHAEAVQGFADLQAENGKA